MANLQCDPAANILPYQADVSGSGDNIPTTNFLRIAYGTTPGGPYPFFSSADAGTNSVGQVITKTLTGLSPNTAYYYVVQELNSLGVAIDTGGECNFITGSYNPQCQVNSLSPNTLPASASVTATADNVPPDLELKIKWGTTPGGPYPNTLASVPGDNTVGQTLTVPNWVLSGCTDYYWVAEVSEPDGFLYSPNQLANGDMEASTGIGAASSVGPGWNTDYDPCGPNLFVLPCSAGNYSFFTTNSGQVAGGNYPALGARSFAVNVSSVLTDRIIYWDDIYLENGKTYRLHGDAGCIFGPFAIDIRVDGTLITPLNTVACGTNIWASTDTEFVWTGPTGLHTVSLNSGSTVFGGNDHVLDNITLQERLDPDQSTECVVDSTATVCLPATDIGMTEATLNSLTCSIFGGTFTSFVYGTSPGLANDLTSYPNETSPVLQPGDGAASQNISHSIQSLECGTTYYYRSVSRDSNYQIISVSVDECSFTTEECAQWCGGQYDPATCLAVDIDGDGDTDYLNCWPQPIRDGFPGEAV